MILFNRLALLKGVMLCTSLFIVNSFSTEIYSLEKCLKIAMENNGHIESANLNKQMAEETESSAFPAYFPKIFAGAFAFASNDYLIKKDMDISGLATSLGGTLTTLGVPPAALSGFPTSLPIEMVDNGIVGHLTIIQPVFAGGRIHNGNEMAKMGTQAAKLQELISQNEVRKNTESYYWLIISLKEKIKTLDTADKQIENIQGDVKTAVNAGVRVQNDLLRVELEQKKLKSNRLKVMNGIALAKMMLARQMGLDHSDFDLDEADIQNLPSPDNFKINTDEAVNKRAESKLLAIGRKVAEKEKSIERGKTLPTVSVGASMLFNNLLDENILNGIIFASLSVPISDWWSNNHSTSKYDIKAKKAAVDERENRELMKVDIESKWNAINESYEQVQISRESITQAEENLRIQRDFYNTGTATMTSLLEAQTLHRQALDAYTDAATSYFTSINAYLIATGR